MGMGTIDKDKPFLCVIGHNVGGVTYMMDYMEEHELTDR